MKNWRNDLDLLSLQTSLCSCRVTHRHLLPGLSRVHVPADFAPAALRQESRQGLAESFSASGDSLHIPGSVRKHLHQHDSNGAVSSPFEPMVVASCVYGLRDLAGDRLGPYPLGARNELPITAAFRAAHPVVVEIDAPDLQLGAADLGRPCILAIDCRAIRRGLGQDPN